jgi:hypothetical protein
MIMETGQKNVTLIKQMETEILHTIRIANQDLLMTGITKNAVLMAINANPEVIRIIEEAEAIPATGTTIITEAVTAMAITEAVAVAIATAEATGAAIAMATAEAVVTAMEAATGAEAITKAATAIVTMIAVRHQEVNVAVDKANR